MIYWSTEIMNVVFRPAGSNISYGSEGCYRYAQIPPWYSKLCLKGLTTNKDMSDLQP